MPGADANYELFIKSYLTKNFPFAGKLVYQIVSSLPGLAALPKDEWQYKFSELTQFLHQTMFMFDGPDSFYDMLATIAVQLRRNPNTDWKAVLV